MGDLGPAGEGVGGDGEVVVLAGDLHPARGQVLHRVVAAVVPEGQLHRLGADGPAQELVPEADAEDRDLLQQPGDGGDGVGHHRGSPGPLERKTPSGSRASTSAAGVAAGTTSTVARAPRWRSIVRLMPKS